jgi:hypothetical protein
VAFLVILAPLLHNPPRPNTVPPHLIGTWQSAAPGYEDRYMRLLEHALIFGTGGYDGEAYIIAEVQIEPLGQETKGSKPGKSLVTIRYMKVDKLEYQLAFVYDPVPVDTITFKNQDALKWTKKG